MTKTTGIIKNTKLNNVEATVNPTVIDDITKGYEAGSIWINTTVPVAYICRSNEEGYADWAASAGGISYLIDVDTMTNEPVVGQTLVWDGLNWVPGDSSTSIETLNDVSDVDTSTTAPTSGDTLTWNGTSWAPSNKQTLEFQSDTLPNVNDVLTYDGTKWVAMRPGSNTIASVTGVFSTKIEQFEYTTILDQTLLTGQDNNSKLLSIPTGHDNSKIQLFKGGSKLPLSEYTVIDENTIELTTAAVEDENITIICYVPFAIDEETLEEIKGVTDLAVLNGPSAGNETSTLTFVITNYSNDNIYGVTVSTGEFTRSGDTIKWTLPKVDVSAEANMTVTSSAPRLISSTVSRDINIKAVNFTEDQGFLYENETMSEFNNLHNMSISSDDLLASPKKYSLMLDSNHNVSSDLEVKVGDLVKFDEEYHRVTEVTFSEGKWYVNKTMPGKPDYVKTAFLVTSRAESRPIIQDVGETNFSGISNITMKSQVPNRAKPTSEVDLLKTNYPMVKGEKLIVKGGGIGSVHWNNKFKEYSHINGATGSFKFSPDGLRMYVFNNSNQVHEILLTTPYDIISMSAEMNHTINYSDDGLSYMTAGDFSADGTKLYVVGRYLLWIYVYDLSTAWDLSTAVLSTTNRYNRDATPGFGDVRNITLSTDGTKMFLTGTSTGIVVYNFSEAFDSSTIIIDETTYILESAPANYYGYHIEENKVVLGYSSATDIAFYTMDGYDLSTAVLDYKINIGQYTSLNLYAMSYYKDDTVEKLICSNSAKDFYEVELNNPEVTGELIVNNYYSEKEYTSPIYDRELFSEAGFGNMYNAGFGTSMCSNSKYTAIGAYSSKDKTNWGVNSGSVFVYDNITKEQIFEFNNPNINISSVDDYFGYTIVMNENYLAVTARYEDASGTNSGTVYVYDLSTGELINHVSNPNIQVSVTNDEFGQRIHMNEDKLFIGANYEDAGATDSGTVYVYDLSTISSTNFELIKTLHSNIPTTSARFGISISSYGNILAISEFERPVQLFDMNNDFTYIKSIGDTTYSSAGFGYSSLILTEDKLFVGAYLDDTTATDSGAVYVFNTSDGSLIRKVKGSNPEANDYFGKSIEVDGNILYVGAYYKKDSSGVVGWGSVYKIDITTGEELSIYNAEDYDNRTNLITDTPYFGITLSLIDTELWVGAYNATSSASKKSGAVYVIDTTTGDKIKKVEAVSDVVTSKTNFGWSMKSTERLLAISAPNTDSNEFGFVSVYESTNGTPLYTVSNPNSKNTTDTNQNQSDSFGQVIALSDLYLAVSAPGEDTPSGEGTVYIFDARNGDYIRKIDRPGTNAINWGKSGMDIDGDIIAIGNSAYLTGWNKGAVFAYNIKTGEREWILEGEKVSYGHFGAEVSLENDFLAVQSYGGYSSYGGYGIYRVGDKDNISITNANYHNYRPGNNYRWGNGLKLHNGKLGVSSITPLLKVQNLNKTDFDSYHLANGSDISLNVNGHSCLDMNDDYIVAGFQTYGNYGVIIVINLHTNSRYTLYAPGGNIAYSDFGASVALSGDVLYVSRPKYDRTDTNVADNEMGVVYRYELAEEIFNVDVSKVTNGTIAPSHVYMIDSGLSFSFAGVEKGTENRQDVIDSYESAVINITSTFDDIELIDGIDNLTGSDRVQTKVSSYANSERIQSISGTLKKII